VTSSVSIPFPNTVRLHALASTLGEALFVQNIRPFQASVRAPEEETVGCGFYQDTLGTNVRQKCIGKKNRRLGTLRYPSLVAWPAIGWGGAFATDFPTAQAATPVFLMCANAPAAASRRFLPSQAKDRQQQEKNAIMNPLLCVCVCVCCFHQ
jgi:hypothetical protein